MARSYALSPEMLAHLNGARHVPTLAFVAVQFAVCMSKWAMRRETRRALRQLEPWQLADVGLTPLEAQREASKAFWQA